MNELATQRHQPFNGSSAPLTIELAKMLALVAPSSMTTEQQELWLRAAVDALEDIRADEVAHVSAEVRRAVTRHNQIVPEICKRVALKREEQGKRARMAALPPLPEVEPRRPGPPLSADEIRAMPKWLRDVGIRVGFLRRDGDRLVDASR